MNDSDALRDLLIEFFQLPPTTPAGNLTQASVGQWDSLAMVQSITEMQSTFHVGFELDEIEGLTSYSESREALLLKNVTLLA